jgi:hypothetical protein
MKHVQLALAMVLSSLAFQSLSQGLGIPSKKAGLGFGNLPSFTGIRFNFKDRDLVAVNGINVTAWMPKDEDAMSGTVSGLALGVPLAAGSGSIHGLGIGVFGVGARRNLYGINAGGLGVGAGGNVKGINVGGLGVGSGGTLWGINIGGLGVGAGGRVTGLNVGGLGVGAGGNLSGINVGGLGVGAAGKVSGINVGGLGIGSGGGVSGISMALVGVGSGSRVNGITVAGIGIGAGEAVSGLAVAGIGVGSPTVRGIVISPAAGGNNLKGFMIVPAYLRVGDPKNTDSDHDGPAAIMKGVSISAFNHIMGSFNGLSIGIFNYAYHQRGLQLGILNHVKDNPPGLRWLPIFNTSFN